MYGAYVIQQLIVTAIFSVLPNICGHTSKFTLSDFFPAKVKQAISAREQALCQLTMRLLSFRVEVKAEKDTKVVPCKWYSEVKVPS